MVAPSLGGASSVSSPHLPGREREGQGEGERRRGEGGGRGEKAREGRREQRPEPALAKLLEQRGGGLAAPLGERPLDDVGGEARARLLRRLPLRRRVVRRRHVLAVEHLDRAARRHAAHLCQRGRADGERAALGLLARGDGGLEGDGQRVARQPRQVRLRGLDRPIGLGDVGVRLLARALRRGLRALPLLVVLEGGGLALVGLGGEARGLAAPQHLARRVLRQARLAHLQLERVDRAQPALANLLRLVAQRVGGALHRGALALDEGLDGDQLGRRVVQQLAARLRPAKTLVLAPLGKVRQHKRQVARRRAQLALGVLVVECGRVVGRVPQAAQRALDVGDLRVDRQPAHLLVVRLVGVGREDRDRPVGQRLALRGSPLGVGVAIARAVARRRRPGLGVSPRVRRRAVA